MTQIKTELTKAQLPNTKKYFHKLDKLIFRQCNDHTNTASSDITIILLIAGWPKQNTAGFKDSHNKLSSVSKNYNLKHLGNIMLPRNMYNYLTMQDTCTYSNNINKTQHNNKDDFDHNLPVKGASIGAYAFKGYIRNNYNTSIYKLKLSSRPSLFDISTSVAHCILKICDLIYIQTSEPTLAWSQLMFKKNKKNYSYTIKSVLGAYICINDSNSPDLCNYVFHNTDIINKVSTTNAQHTYFISSNELVAAFNVMNLNMPLSNAIINLSNAKLKQTLISTKIAQAKTIKIFGKVHMRKLCRNLTLKSA